MDSSDFKNGFILYKLFQIKFFFLANLQTDTASVLSEAIECIKFLHGQLSVSLIWYIPSHIHIFIIHLKKLYIKYYICALIDFYHSVKLILGPK